jgi:hypothetical protein
MEATPERQLALNFLSVIHSLWVEHPDTYTVKEVADDLVPALAQICIKALARDIRNTLTDAEQQAWVIDGSIVDGPSVLKGGIDTDPLNLRDVLNKIIHGAPTLVVVQDGVVHLHFRNTAIDRKDPRNRWTEAWFSGTQMLQILGEVLSKHSGDRLQERERKIMQLIEKLGTRQFLPTRYIGK